MYYFKNIDNFFQNVNKMDNLIYLDISFTDHNQNHIEKSDFVCPKNLRILVIHPIKYIIKKLVCNDKLDKLIIKNYPLIENIINKPKYQKIFTDNYSNSESEYLSHNYIDNDYIFYSDDSDDTYDVEEEYYRNMYPNGICDIDEDYF